MPTYQIRDAFDGRTIETHHRLKLSAVKRRAQEIADETGEPTHIINLHRNTAVGNIEYSPQAPAPIATGRA